MKKENSSMSAVRQDNSNHVSIIALGGGNAEYLYELEKEIITGEKNAVVEAMELAGGGGMNFSSRLIAAGVETFPILAVGDDRSGVKIQQELKFLAKNAKRSKELQEFIGGSGFLVPELTTAFATLIVLSSKRTILNYRARGNALVFKRYVDKRLKQVARLTNVSPTVIHMSHLPNFPSESPLDAEIGNEIIKDVLRTYGKKSMLSFNPGASQIQYGIRYWEKDLAKTSILQLNISEAKEIFSRDGLSTSLIDMINWFKNRSISVVITLDRFGAIGSYKNGRDGIIFAWPIELPEREVVDPTGAGDAFAAGVISEVCKHPNFGFQEFLKAVNTGRYWSAYACTTLGGAGSCPDMETIENFRKEIEHKRQSPIEILYQEHAGRDLMLINKAFA